MIKSISCDMLMLLKYDYDNIINRFIGIIMSLYMSLMHKQFIIQNFNSCGIIERNKLENKIKRVCHNKRPILIYDIDGKSHSVNVCIIYNKCPFTTFNPFSIPIEALTKHFYLVFEIIHEPLDLFYTHIPIKDDYTFIETQSKVVIICIDFVDSTTTLTSIG